jgi:O-antigen/teichoic acid export membrane protein
VSFEIQLFGNQLWELVAFLAKAAFFFVLTPLMVQSWGTKAYGTFALASSFFLVLGLLDFGIRPRLRILLCRQYRDGKQRAFSHTLREAIFSQSRITLPAVVVVLLIAAGGIWRRWLHLGPDGDLVVLITTLCAVIYLLSSLTLEPLIARGHLGHTKMAGALAAIASIPAVWMTVRAGFPLIVSLLVWFGCLIAGNLSAPLLCRRETKDLAPPLAVGPRSSFALRDGFYFQVSTLSWLAKTHLLTIIVAVLGGPTAAGYFFVCLRLSEIISNFGAMSSDAAIGGLAQAKGAGERRRCFAGVMHYTIFFSLQATFAIIFLAPPFVAIWWSGTAFLDFTTAVLIGFFGLSMALNRVISFAAFGLNLERLVAKCGFLDAAVGVLCASVLYPKLGLNGILLGSSLGSLGLLPLIKTTLGRVSRGVFLAISKELRQIAPWVCASGLLLACGRWSRSLITLSVAATFVSILSVIWIYRRKNAVSPTPATSMAATQTVSV